MDSSSNKRSREPEEETDMKRFRAELFLDSLEEVSEPDYTDLDYVMKSLEEEILLRDPGLEPEPETKEADLGFILEASDDELGLPPAADVADVVVTACVEEGYGDVTLGGDVEANIWGGDVSFGFGDDGAVNFDGNFFEDMTWQTEFLPAL